MSKQRETQARHSRFFLLVLFSAQDMTFFTFLYFLSLFA